jgi:hypothetical protein
MKTLPYLDLEMLQKLWEELEGPLVIHFDAESINICNKSRLFFIEMAEKYEIKGTTFFNSWIKKDDIANFLKEYGVQRFPFMLIYDYGNILHKWNSYFDLREQFEICLKEAIANVT